MPYWRLSGLYFFYFAAGGVLFPFWGLYLKQQGFSSPAIGKLMAIVMATKVIAPSLWAMLTPRGFQPIRQVQLAAFLSWLALLGVFWISDLWHLAVIMTLFSFFWHVSLPQFETLTLNYLRGQVHRYATIRLWGSIGFIITVISLGQALEYLGTWVIPIVLLVLYIGIWLASLLIPTTPNYDPVFTPTATLVPLTERFALFSTCFLMQMSHGVYYAFYSLYLAQYGYSKALIGTLWALGVVCEVGLFLLMYQILHRHGARSILITSLIIAVVRWLLIGTFPDWLGIIILAQSLHAATFAAFHAAAIHLVHHYFPGNRQGLGQVLYSSLGFGAGGAAGSLISGYLWTKAGSTFTFAVAAGLALLGAIVAWVWVDPQHNY